MTTKKKATKKQGILGGRTGKPDPEKLDPTPVEMPLGYCEPTPLEDMIARMVRQAVQEEKGEDYESPADADDFEPDDEDVLDFSPYILQEVEEEEPLTVDITPESASPKLPEPEPTTLETGAAPEPPEAASG